MYKTSYKFQQLQLESHGENFFEESLQNASDIVFYEDLDGFKKAFKKKNVMDAIKKDGIFTYTI